MGFELRCKTAGLGRILLGKVKVLAVFDKM